MSSKHTTSTEPGGALPRVPDADFIARVREGEPAAVGRALTLIERDGEAAQRLLEAVTENAPPARRILVTGPPGVGKSSLLRALAAELRRRGERVGIIACDPVSPYTKGAFLGDRVRLSELASDRGVFFRSVAHRDARRLLGRRAADMAKLLGAAGYTWVFIETVGAGQAEAASKEDVDVRLLVLSPGCGDEIQMLKAGMIEGADVYAVNKTDLPEGDVWRARLLEALTRPDGSAPPVAGVVATSGVGVRELLEALDAAISRRKPEDEGEAAGDRTGFEE